jgi:PAT family beta-lactamase induction signal transducer AmpG
MPPAQTESKQSLLRSKMFWIGVLYFSEGFPLGIFYDVFPVQFRQQGVELADIGFLSLLGLAWTLKFIWAPAVDHYRHHRRWIMGANLVLAAVMLLFALYAEFGAWVWYAVGLFTLASATNDIAIDGYTIEMLDTKELGIANGLRIAFYRVGMLAAGGVLILSDYLGWTGAYLSVVGVVAGIGLFILIKAPPEQVRDQSGELKLSVELRTLLARPAASGAVIALLLGVVWLIDRVTQWSADVERFWYYCIGAGLILWSLALFRQRLRPKAAAQSVPLTQGPMFGALLELLQRPYMLWIVAFILMFKLGDAAMGFMVKPFWVDAGFSASQIGLVSVNLGLALSIAGGVVGGWVTDRVGIFHALWSLGLLQAVSNLGYAWAAHVLPVPAVADPNIAHQYLIYAASAVESFTGGLGTAAFLAFLMAIVNKAHSATEYALLSSVFALSRSLAGWASGYGAQYLGYAPYFLLTFFLAFPAYALLPWVRTMLTLTTSQSEEQRSAATD